MQQADADRQISQMIEFIKQEAREKAEEIFTKTEAEFNAKKLGQIVKARAELKDQYANKRKEVAGKKRIARSRQINSARFDQMRERDQILKELKLSIVDKLSEVSKHPKYQDFLLSLIVQGLLTILEHQVEIRCRETDVALVKKVLPTAVEQFKALVEKEVGGAPEIEVTISDTRLPPAAVKGQAGVSCAGGVVLVARAGKIICRNTLDTRFEQAFAELLPMIRNTVFGKRSGVKTAPKREEQKHH